MFSSFIGVSRSSPAELNERRHAAVRAQQTHAGKRGHVRTRGEPDVEWTRRSGRLRGDVMDAGRSQLPPNRAQGSALESLGSWKEIAAYLKRDERTVRRWEKDGLPIHRHMHKSRASVYAFKPDVDVWWQRDRLRLEAGEVATTGRHRRLAAWIAGAAVALPIVLLGFN